MVGCSLSGGDEKTWCNRRPRTFFIFFSAEVARCCSFAQGYFHQVTRLKGKVIGRNYKPLGPAQWLQYVRWLRQRSVDEADLTLYKYVWPFTDRKELAETAHRSSSSSGDFDFGPIPEGHYYLAVSKGDLLDGFEVEITHRAKPTKSITLDVSPVFPDCKAGHEFIVQN